MENRNLKSTARLNALKPRLEARHQCLKAIRAWFDQQGFLEVETPIRIPSPALEQYIDAEPSGQGFLRTSPEFHLKRMLAAGYDRLYQIGPCFRQGERGAIHHPEFSMLEWYRTGATYREILDDTTQLIRACARALHGSLRWETHRGMIDVGQDWQRLTVADAFQQYAGWDPVARWDAERFDVDLVEKVEPGLPHDRPVILMDYPLPAAAFSRRSRLNPGVAERWELYLAGMEIANAYSELTDPDEQAMRYEQDAADRRRRGKPVYPRDEAFLQALHEGLPECAGIALGVDRLVMALTGAETLDEVVAFREIIPD